MCLNSKNKIIVSFEGKEIGELKTENFTLEKKTTEIKEKSKDNCSFSGKSTITLNMNELSHETLKSLLNLKNERGESSYNISLKLSLKEEVLDLVIESIPEDIMLDVDFAIKCCNKIIEFLINNGYVLENNMSIDFNKTMAMIMKE